MTSISNTPRSQAVSSASLADTLLLAQAQLMRVAVRPPRIMLRGSGSYLWDDQDTRYLDFVQGWAVNALGHAPPEIAAALAAQAQTLITASPAFHNAPQLQFALELTRAAGFGSGPLYQQRCGGERSRAQAGAQVGSAAPRRRAPDHHHPGQLSRSHAGVDGSQRKARLGRALSTRHARLRKSAVR